MTCVAGETRSLAPIMGGPNWHQRLDPAETDRAVATMELSRQDFKNSSGYKYSLSTMVRKKIKDRSHFALMVGTNNPKGVETFIIVYPNLNPFWSFKGFYGY